MFASKNSISGPPPADLFQRIFNNIEPRVFAAKATTALKNKRLVNWALHHELLILQEFTTEKSSAIVLAFITARFLHQVAGALRRQVRDGDKDYTPAILKTGEVIIS